MPVDELRVTYIVKKSELFLHSCYLQSWKDEQSEHI